MWDEEHLDTPGRLIRRRSFVVNAVPIGLRRAMMNAWDVEDGSWDVRVWRGEEQRWAGRGVTRKSENWNVKLT